jgi:catechol 2,3-dioxygenase-like lactoylglutathione lyase family enzyme
MTRIRHTHLRSIAALALLLGTVAWTARPEQSTVEPVFTAARGAFIGLSVGDLDASVRWYTEKLGLRVTQRPPKIQQSTAVILEGGGLIVELMHHDAAVPLRTAAPAVNANYLVHGIFKAGIIVDDFDRTVAMLRERGIPIAIGPFPATAEQRANLIIKDNAGNFIQFFGPR